MLRLLSEKKNAKKMPRYYCFEVVYKISSSNDHYFGRKQGSTEPAKTTNLARARKTTRAWQPCCIKAPAVVRPTRASCPDNYRSAAMLYLTWREPARQLGLSSHVLSKRPQAVVRPSRASCTDNYRLAAMLYLIRRTRTGRALNWVAAVLFQRNLRICD